MAKRKPVPAAVKNATLFDKKPKRSPKPAARKRRTIKKYDAPIGPPELIGPREFVGPPERIGPSERIGPGRTAYGPGREVYGPASEGVTQEFIGPVAAKEDRARADAIRLKEAATEERKYQAGKAREKIAKKAGVEYRKGDTSKDIRSRVYSKKAKTALKYGGLAALGLLVGSRVKGLAERGMGVEDNQILRDAIYDLEASERQGRMNRLTEQARAMSYEDSIQRNLLNLQRQAPDLYASVAAGRALPQGGVVIGGAPRQDLLNELGRAMSEGRFSR